MRKPAPPRKIFSRLPKPLLLIGAGKMGVAMLEGWLTCGLSPKNLTVIEPKPGRQLKALVRHGLKLNPSKIPSNLAAVVIAVKPQIAAEAILPIRSVVERRTLVLSIMAGRKLEFLTSVLPANTAIIRAMPNTPAAVGRGITVAVANDKVSLNQRKQATALLAAIGKVEWIDDEGHMDAVTAVSGSGPAYVFLLAESMAKAGIAAGLGPELAERLARETIVGAGELLAKSASDPATLRQNVTSPGGTTAAALDVLMEPAGFDALLTKAVAAATKRSRELAG